jgi:hypothetical protein
MQKTHNGKLNIFVPNKSKEDARCIGLSRFDHWNIKDI